MKQFTTCTLLILILLAYFIFPALVIEETASGRMHAIVKTVSGKVSLIYVQELGKNYKVLGHPVYTEAVFKLSTKPNIWFHFHLRNDQESLVNQAYFDILRDAYNNNYTVSVLADISTSKPADTSVMALWISRERGIGRGTVKKIPRSGRKRTVQT